MIPTATANLSGSTTNNGHANHKSPPAGIYCPTVTFFENTPAQPVDLVAQESHTRFLLSARLAGLTVHGTNGEAPLLSCSERNAITKLCRNLRDEIYPPTALVVGCSAQSTWETVKLCEDAAESGGEYALVLPPSYWAKAMGTPDVLQGFYKEVADRSPIPVIVYSFPAVCQGVDMDSDLIATLAEHPNIVGVKLTCGNAGKLARLTSLFQPSKFAVFGGSTEWLVPGLAAGSSGAVTGLANTHPHSCVRLFNLYKAGKIEEAQKLQGVVARTEWAMAKTGMNGTKYAVERFASWRQGVEDEKVLPRRPLMECAEETKKWIEGRMTELAEVERGLEAEVQGQEVKN